MENVHVTYTETGAMISVVVDGRSFIKNYATMNSASREAEDIGLISAGQRTFLARRGEGSPFGLSNETDAIDVKELIDSGFIELVPGGDSSPE